MALQFPTPEFEPQSEGELFVAEYQNLIGYVQALKQHEAEAAHFSFVARDQLADDEGVPYYSSIDKIPAELADDLGIAGLKHFFAESQARGLRQQVLDQQISLTDRYHSKQMSVTVLHDATRPITAVSFDSKRRDFVPKNYPMGAKGQFSAIRPKENIVRLKAKSGWRGISHFDIDVVDPNTLMPLVGIEIVE